MTDNTQQREEQINSYIKIAYRPNTIIFGGETRFPTYIPFIITRMTAGSQIFTGYSAIAAQLGQIYGHRHARTIPLTLTGETHTVSDTNKLMGALFNDMMASRSIYRGKEITICFGVYELVGCIITEAQLSLLGGTLGATAQLSIPGVRTDNMVYRMSKPALIDKARVTTLSGGTFRINALERGAIYLDSMSQLPPYNPKYITIRGISYMFRENIKTTGEQNTIGIISPPYPCVVTIDIATHSEPQITMGEGGDLEGRDVAMELFNMIYRGMQAQGRITIVTSFYGETVLLLQDAQLIYHDSINTSVRVIGNVLVNIPGTECVDELMGEEWEGGPNEG